MFSYVNVNQKSGKSFHIFWLNKFSFLDFFSFEFEETVDKEDDELKELISI